MRRSPLPVTASASGVPAGLLAATDRRRFGPVAVVRISPGGRATRRESLFDPAALARLPQAGLASLVAGPRRIASVATRRRSAP